MNAPWHYRPFPGFVVWVTAPRVILPRLLAAALLLGFALPVRGSEPPSLDQVKAALAKATDYLTSISTEGGYLWQYSEDLQQRRGEEVATPTQIWVQPPGTPAVGMAFVAAYQATGDERHLAAAEAAAHALVRGQLESGGWNYLVEFDPAARTRWAYRVDSKSNTNTAARRNNTTTFDDDNTQSALRFLYAFKDAATNRPSETLKPITDALAYGLVNMMAAQYPIGAWPQRHASTVPDPAKHPVRPARIPENWPREWPNANYGGFYTLNDQTQRDCIRTILAAAKSLGYSSFILGFARKGGEFLILAQLPEPQPGWAQQYNPEMEPTWARAFEPPAVCSNESGGAVRTLVDLYLETGEEKYLKPVPPFIAWLKRSQLGTNRWARFYELSTNKPIYGDRDGKIHYTLAEISEERQRGYAWEGSFGLPEIIAYYEAVRSQGRERYLAAQKEREAGSRASSDEIARILSQQDAQGRWLTGGWIEMRRFVANMEALAGYLRAH